MLGYDLLQGKEKLVLKSAIDARLKACRRPHGKEDLPPSGPGGMLL